MKYVIDHSKIKFGDILLINTNDRTCQRIRELSNSKYSHALIYKGNGSCLESNALGVQSVNPQRLLFDKYDDACAFRLKDESQIESLEKGLANASRKVGMGYASRHEIMKSYEKTLELAQEGKRQFCTRFVAQIYGESGNKIVDNADYCSPKDIEISKTLAKIEPILKEATEEEIELASDENNVVTRQTEATFNFLDGIRQLTGEDLQTFDDVDVFLTKNPEYDQKFDVLIKDTDYFKLGDMEKYYNAEMYDFDLYLKKFGIVDGHKIANDELLKELNRKFNYEQAIVKYQKLFQQTNCNYFKSHSECYKRQLELSLERLIIFKRMLKNI